MHEPVCLIGGEVVATNRTLPVIEPSTGEEIGAIARSGAAEIDQAVYAAQAALLGTWGQLDAAERGGLLHRFSVLIRENAESLAKAEALDVGKPLGQARTDALACARYFEFYAGAADKVHGQTIPYRTGYTVLTLREPHGVTGHIIPWNYPMQIIGRSVGAALAMGNACVVKPGEDAAQTALMLGRLAGEAGLPPGAFNVVPGLGAEAGAALSSHPGVGHVSFTGSGATGALVQKAAADNAVPVTLELGGKSPQLIFADADLEAALPFLVTAAVKNAGQTCSAGSRLLIEDSIYDAVTARVAEAFRSLRVGPAIDNPDVGPLINAKQCGRAMRYLAAAGDLPVLAQAPLPAHLPEGGFYVAPTVIGEVPPASPLAQEEVFGPVLACIRVRDEADAVEIANGTRYGLVAGVWTRDGARQLRLARALRAGQVFINNYGAGGGVELPFGGVGGSGHGREKGFEALYGFSSLKTVAIRHGEMQ
ncbi:MAG: aldehyde dehydrogenase family protein [Candidatus Thorarchaeota archaeon]|jgi:aldehyde dehydrogenase (NAD+)